MKIRFPFYFFKILMKCLLSRFKWINVSKLIIYLQAIQCCNIRYRGTGVKSTVLMRFWYIPFSFMTQRLICNEKYDTWHYTLLLNVAWETCLWHHFCISACLNSKFQDGRRRPYWKCNSKINGHRNPFYNTMDIETRLIPLFLLNVAWKVHFWHHFCIWRI